MDSSASYSDNDDEEDIRKLNAVLETEEETRREEFSLAFEDYLQIKQQNEDEEEEDELPAEEIDDEILELDDLDVSNITNYTPEDATLKASEKAVIESCTDPDLKNLLIYNRRKNMQLIKHHKIFKDLLIECRKDIHECKQKTTIEKEDCFNNHRSLGGIWKLSAPYFKDKEAFPAPCNDDILRKKLNNELSVYKIFHVKYWSQKEYDDLVKAVKLNYNLNMQKDRNRKIRNLKSVLLHGSEDDEHEDRIHKEILHLELEIKSLKENEGTLVPPLNSSEFIDWYRISDFFLKGKHTASECEAIWNVYLHPYINKKPWSAAENDQIKLIAERHGFQDWDQIAAELDTKRTGFAVFLHYRTKLHEKVKKDKFTVEEDEKLMSLVQKYKNLGVNIPWSQITHHFKGRQRDQVFHRYKYHLEPVTKRERFSEDEDVLLLVLVDRFGKNYSKCAEFFPGRSRVQIKNRYTSNLEVDIKKGGYTKEDDQKILDHVRENGTKHWRPLANEMKRCIGQLRQRHKTLAKFVKKHPDAKVEDAARRQYRGDGSELSLTYLRLVADKFKHLPRVPTLEEIQLAIRSEIYVETVDPENPTGEGLKIKMTSIMQTNVDEIITSYFMNHIKGNTKIHKVSTKNLKKAVDAAETLLEYFNADLNIPMDVDSNTSLDTLDKHILINLADRKFKKSKISVRKNLYKPGVEAHSVVMGLKAFTPSTTNTMGPSTSKTNVNPPLKKIELNFLPPCASSLLGIRKLIDRFRSYKSYSNDNIYNTIKTLKEVDKSDLENATFKELYRNFKFIFAYPACLTIYPPSKPLMDSLSTTQVAVTVPTFKPTKTYVRKKRDPPENPAKKIKYEEPHCKEPREFKIHVTEVPPQVNDIEMTEQEHTETAEQENIQEPVGSYQVTIDKIPLKPAIPYIRRKRYNSFPKGLPPEKAKEPIPEKVGEVVVKKLTPASSDKTKAEVVVKKLTPVSKDVMNALKAIGQKPKIIKILKTKHVVPHQNVKPNNVIIVKNEPPFAETFDFNQGENIDTFEHSGLNLSTSESFETMDDEDNDEEDLKKLNEFLKQEVVDTDYDDEFILG